MKTPARLGLAINAGSSSVRLATWSLDEPRPNRVHSEHFGRDTVEPGAAFLRSLGGRRADDVSFVVHRVVHGGQRSSPGVIDPALEAEIVAASRLAPLHNPRALEWIRKARAFFGPRVVQVAVFDTAFFADLPPVAATYALPRELVAKHGLRRYGFHGIAHESLWSGFCAERPDLAGRGRAISLQLGSGCSAAAIAGGRALDTSMGFTPLEGLVMATRSGDVDPGLLLHLQRVESLSPDATERLLDERSGLAGVSGRSGDMRELLASPDGDAALAVELFAYRVRKYVGAYLAVLGGADAVILGGGIGESSPAVRARILTGMEWCGIELDRTANEAANGTARVSTSRSRIEVWVVPTDEEALLVAKATSVMKGAGT
jgi:acetate kinase